MSKLISQLIIPAPIREEKLSVKFSNSLPLRLKKSRIKGDESNTNHH